MWLLWAAVSALLALPGALLDVAAPENVRVRCGDQRPLVSWEYRSQQPTIFEVQLNGSGQSITTRTPDHELDLNPFVWSSHTQMFEYFYVRVTAKQGPHRSESRESPSFSYSRYKAVDQTCNLTFPPINLTREGADATLSMENPLYFYNELRTIEDSAVFCLEIITESGLQEKQCSWDRICKFFVDLPEDAEPCVNLTGFIRYGAEEINVRHMDPVCVTPPTDMLWLFAILFVVIFVCVIALLTVAVCKYRAWAFPKIPTPQTLKLPSSPSSRPSMSQPDTVYSPVQITGPRTSQHPESPGLPESLQVQDEDQLSFLPEDPREDLDESGESTKTETLSLHSSGSEIEESNYESRVQIVEMDLSGDLVRGYTG